jgi:hypothetical protein
VVADVQYFRNLRTDLLPVPINPNQVALLRWYAATRPRTSVGQLPVDLAFDGANIWAANASSNNVTKLRASDGTNLGTFRGLRSPRRGLRRRQHLGIERRQQRQEAAGQRRDKPR